MNAKAASLPKPPSPSRLPEPPKPVEAKNNIHKPEIVQFNVRLDADKHREIKIASIKEGLSMGDYLLFLHDRYQNKQD